MEGSTVKRSQDSCESAHKSYMRSHAFLRAFASVATLVATLIMGFSKETSDIAGFQIQASYKTSPAFKFFVAGNAVACVYLLVSMTFVGTLVEGILLHILDMMTMGLVMAAASSATTIAYLGKKGNDSIGWSKICPYYEKYCTRVGFSLVFSFIGYLLLLFVCVLSAIYKTRLSNSSAC